MPKISYKTVIYSNVKSKLYDQGLTLLAQARAKIARQNGGPFYYGSFEYTMNGIKSSQFFTKEYYVTDLPKEFYPIMDETLEEELALKNEEHIIMTYVRRALNIGNTIQDYKELLPEVFHDYFPQIDPQILEKAGLNKITLPQEEIQSFCQTNEEISDTIKSRLMTNLLLRTL